MFLGRNSELNYLNKKYEAKGSSIVVVYGQRFVGRHALLAEFTKNRSSRTLIARACSGRENRYLWANEIRDNLNKLPEYPEYSEIFKACFEFSEEKQVLIIDEFHNAVKGDPAFMKALIDFVFTSNKGSDLLVILSSRSIGFVESGLVDRVGQYALRIGGFLKVRELKYEDMRRFMPSYTRKETMEMYAILGGYPGLWKHLDPYKTVKENITQVILKPEGFFMSEAVRLVEMDLREVYVYNTILASLAEGRNKLNELHLHSDFSRAKLSVYIKNLMELELVEKAFSVDTDSKGNTQKGVYRIMHPLVHFYYKYVYPNYFLYTTKPAVEFYEQFIEETFRQFVENSMKKIGQELIKTYCDKGIIPFKPEKIGEWVGKLDTIDVVAFDGDGNALIGMCNYDKNVLTTDDYDWVKFLAKKAKLNVVQTVLITFERFDSKVVETGNKNNALQLISLKDQ